MRIAIVHDWLVTYAGAERVLEQILLCYPEADLFSLVDFLPKDERKFIQNKSVQTSFIQKLPLAEKKYRNYLPLMPFAIEQFDLSKYGLIVSSSYAVAKGLISGPDQLHISMCYSPMRYAWDLYHHYLREAGLERGVKGLAAKVILHFIRLWDYASAARVDEFIAISHFISRRIEKIYRRPSYVIYPPVDVNQFSLREEKGDYFVTVSRMVPYKSIPAIVEAFSLLPDDKLVVIGEGPDFETCRNLAGQNVELLGWQATEVVREKIASAKAFIFAAEEDFGIAPLEAQACGTPVIALGKGGALETIKGPDDVQPSGLFFDNSAPQTIAQAIRKFNADPVRFSPRNCRKNVERFSQERFRSEFQAYISAQWEAHQRKKRTGRQDAAKLS